MMMMMMMKMIMMTVQPDPEHVYELYCVEIILSYADQPQLQKDRRCRVSVRLSQFL